MNLRRTLVSPTLAAALIISLAACGDDNTSREAASQAATDAMTGAETPSAETSVAAIKDSGSPSEVENPAEAANEDSHDAPKPGVRIGAADTIWATSIDDLVNNSPTIVIGKIDSPSKGIGVADPTGDHLIAINEQAVSIVEILKDDTASIDPKQPLRILQAGANLNNEKVRESVVAGTAQIADGGLGSLQPGTYVLFLQPSGKSFDPSVDFTGTFTLKFSYQGALPLSADGALSQPGPILAAPADTIELSAEASRAISETYEIRPSFEIPVTLTELRGLVAKSTESASAND